MAHTNLTHYAQGKAHIERLAAHAHLINLDTNEVAPLTVETYEDALDFFTSESCAQAVTYAIHIDSLPMDIIFGVRIRRDGWVDSGSIESLEQLDQ